MDRKGQHLIKTVIHPSHYLGRIMSKSCSSSASLQGMEYPLFQRDPGQPIPKLCRTLVNSYLCIYVCLHICMKAVLNENNQNKLLKLKFNQSIILFTIS